VPPADIDEYDRQAVLAEHPRQCGGVRHDSFDRMDGGVADDAVLQVDHDERGVRIECCQDNDDSPSVGCYLLVRSGMFRSRTVRRTTATPRPPRTHARAWNPLSVAADPNVPVIQGFGSELNQVWTSLILNAVQALEGHGEIAIRTTHDRDVIVVEIEDNGPGIPTEIQSRIFDPFFTTKEPGSGIGMGLSTTFAIVAEMHGGTIAVNSMPGRTKFTVRLPLTLPG